MKAVRAKFSGYCPQCGMNYGQGAFIVKRGERWVHEKCGEPPRPRKRGGKR